jgi:O-antigen biosynthesis protein
MYNPAILTFLPQTEAPVLAALVRLGIPAFLLPGQFVPPPDIMQLIQSSDVEVNEWMTGIVPEVLKRSISMESASRIGTLRQRLPTLVGSNGRAENANLIEMAVVKTYESVTTEIAQIIEALRIYHGCRGVLGVLVDESDAPLPRLGRAWARANNVPIFQLYRDHVRMVPLAEPILTLADYCFAAGSRVAAGLMESKTSGQHIIVTGSPYWERLAQLAHARPARRASAEGILGIPAGTPIVTFLRACGLPLSATRRRASDAATLSFFRAIRRLREQGINFAALVNADSTQGDADAATVRSIADAAGSAQYAYVTSNVEESLLISDAVVGCESAAMVDAALAGAAPINITTVESWCFGPRWTLNDGIPAVAAESDDILASTLREVIAFPGAASAVAADIRAKLSDVIGSLDGGSAGRIAAEIAAVIPGLSRQAERARPTFAWQLLSSERDAAEGEVAGYYDRPRMDMAAMIESEPHLVLEAGCGSGSTGALIKMIFPNARVGGVEMDRRAADIARGRLDFAINANLEELDYSSEGLAPQSIDLALFLDVLEHLRDPWKALLNLRPYLTPNATVLASIPNIRNVWLLRDLIVRGQFRYETEGLLDVTHIRFFTMEGIRRMFAETGYEVASVTYSQDPRTSELPPLNAGVLDMPDLAIRGVDAQALKELATFQYFLTARPLAQV